jgi:hypothetical protein
LISDDRQRQVLSTGRRPHRGRRGMQRTARDRVRMGIVKVLVPSSPVLLDDACGHSPSIGDLDSLMR